LIKRKFKESSKKNMKIKLILKYLKDFIKLGFDSNGNEYFSSKVLKEIKKGLYLDIGCYHPIKDSNTALLYKNGWNGINIDISKKSIEMFNIFRPEDLNLNIGVYIKKGFHNAYFEKPMSTLSSLNKNYLPMVGRQNLIKQKIKVITLKELRKKYKIKKIDFLKIDCESIDEKIILKSSLQDLDCKFLCIEIIPKSHYNKKTNYTQKHFKKNFIKTNIYKKLKKKFKLISNQGHTYLLKKYNN
tara:strand:- start:283 stop:1011 length:729 start_codon:yes stop_codon:yes gene_type:complete